MIMIKYSNLHYLLKFVEAGKSNSRGELAHKQAIFVLASGFFLISDYST